MAAPSWSHLHGPGLAATWSLSPRWQQAGTWLGVSACGLAGCRLLVGTSPLRWTGSHASLLSPVLMRGPAACLPQGSSLSAIQFLGSTLCGSLSPTEDQDQVGCDLGTGISLRQFSRPWRGALRTGIPFPGLRPWLPSEIWKSRSPSVLLDEEKLVGVLWGPGARAGPSLTKPCRPRAGRGPAVSP